MQKLTANQLVALQELSEHPDVDTLGIDYIPSASVHVRTKMDIDPCNILGELNEIFAVRHISSTSHKRDERKTEICTITINQRNVSLVLYVDTTLQKEKPPADTESDEKLIHPEFITCEGVGASV
jgi:hypothetical protein